MIPPCFYLRTQTINTKQPRQPWWWCRTQHSRNTHGGADFEDFQCDNSRLKRKPCPVENESDDSDESDSEHLPSCKRQRITVSAMRRLFAKFSLSDTNGSSQPDTKGESQANSEPSDGATAPPHSPDRPPADSDTENNLNESTQQTSNLNRSSPVTVRSGKRISESDDDEEHGDKRQRTSEDQAGGEEEEKHEKEETTEQEEQREDHSNEEDNKSVAKAPEDTSKNNKRQADTRESDTDDKEEPGSKVKRTRRLRRGLRLCTNITCYIEQVLYN
ncbi:cilia- and flagella-associated protein 251-like isoform X2 [Portunus trituberculatus]|uniref:cilia- and flagella-associated protein 251-like isoform X2 n=1 Tax=Portunus trituberculatus TaxID=210409 RepID=UPI001E1CE4BD|nr:cilia- and flagella-associated protein 251-like isoform X2 [Portunus trituberculatus]